PFNGNTMKRLLSLATLLVLLMPLYGQDKQEASKDSVEKELLKLTNEERSKVKKPVLKQNEVLMRAARQHAEALAKKNSVSETIDGKASLDRLKALGYRFSAAGENVAFGHQTPEELIALWMGSELHRNNMLAAQFKQIGIGQAKAADGTVYVVQIFAAPR